jgi:peptide/nickel transport system permease protein
MANQMAIVGNQTVLAHQPGALTDASAGRLRAVVRRVMRLKLMSFGIVILTLIVGVSIAAPLVAPRDPTEQSILLRLKAPLTTNSDGTRNILGTDHLGRDVLSRVIFGSRISLSIALISATLAGLLGMFLGLIAGYYGGPVGIVVGRLADLQLTLPLVLLALVVVAIIGPSITNIIIVFIITSWPAYTRVIRGSVLQVKGLEYVQAAHAIGAPSSRVVVRHVLPNVLTSVVVLSSFDVARMIQLEASLGFLGLGVPSPAATWGNMLADGREYIRDAWWIAAFPGIAIMLTAAAINFIGDGLRDIFDPRMKE